MQSDNSPYFSTRIAPEWKQIEAIQDGCVQHLRSIGAPDDAVNAVQMAAAELLENAVKYGYYPTADSCIEFSLRVQPNRFTVEVTNPVRESDDENFRRLDAHIQWIRGFQNAFEAYIEKLKEVSSRKNFGAAESGLGLVRIAYEGQSILDFYVNEQNMLCVSAVYTL